MGRPSKYKSHVEPYLEDVSRMALDMTEKQIAESLGVGYRNFIDYKKQYPQLVQALKNGRKQLVRELKSTLIKKARGYNYDEVKVSEKRFGSQLEVTARETYTRHAAPDVAAINLLLKNYDKENWANDPQALELKRKELELKDKLIKANHWEVLDDGK